MKRTVLHIYLFISILFLSALPVHPVPELEVVISQTTIKKLKNRSYRVDCRVAVSEETLRFLSDHKVPYSTEYYLIENIIPGDTIHERDFLYANLNIDLNNDGDLLDTYPVSTHKNSLFLNKVPVHVISYDKKYKGFNITRYLSGDKKLMINTIDNNGKNFWLYYYNRRVRRILIGIEKKKNTELLFLDGPNVRCRIIKPVNSIKKAPACSFREDKTYFRYFHKRIFDGYESPWNGEYWTVKPVRKKTSNISFIISGIAAPFAVQLQFDAAMDHGARLSKEYPLNYVRQ